MSYRNDAPISNPKIITETLNVPRMPQLVFPVKSTVSTESRSLVKPLVDIDVFEREPAIKNSMESNMPVITSVRSLNSLSTVESPRQTSNLLPTTYQTLKLKCPGGAVDAERFHQNAISKLNSAVAKTMQSICAIQKRNSINIPAPVARTLSSLQWKYFLQAFVKDLIFVWEVRVNRRTIIAATKQNVMPQVLDAVSATNIRALPRDKLPLIGKMLIDGLLTDEMKLLSVLKSGHDDYWHIIGFLNSQQDYLMQRCVIGPTSETRPRISSKVNALYKLLFLREMNLQTNQTTTQPANQNTERSTQTTTQKPTVISTTAAYNEAKTSPDSRATCGIPLTKLPRSNLAISSFVQNQAGPIVIPIAITADHYWLMLEIFDDFSHIYFPEWKHFLRHDRIREALTIASNYKKTVRLGKITDNVDIYATSYSNCYVYIGPFYEQREPNLLLYQNIDGRMVLREDFEKSKKIKRINKTIGYWLRIKNSTLIYDVVPKKSAGNESEASRKEPIDVEQDPPSSDSSKLLPASTEPPPAKRSNISRDVPGTSGSVVLGVGEPPKKIFKIHSPTSMPNPRTASVKIIAVTSPTGASNIKGLAMTNSKGISQSGMLKITKSGTFLQLAPNTTTKSEFVESSVNKPTNVNTAPKSTFAAWQPLPLSKLEYSSLPNDSNKWKPSTLTSIDSKARRKSTGQINHLTGSQAKIPLLQRHATTTDATELGSSFTASNNDVPTKINEVSTTTMTTARYLGSPTGEIRCDECNKVFTKISYLKQHNNALHSSDRPFRCNRCGKRFLNEKIFDLHYAKHSAAQKPYGCQLCPKQFDNKSDLIRHLDWHIGHITTTSEFVESSVDRPTNLNTTSKSTFVASQPPPLANLEHSNLPNDSNKWKPSQLTSISSEAKRESTVQISYLTDNQAKMPTLQRHTTPITATPLGSSLAARSNDVPTNINDVSTTTMTTTKTMPTTTTARSLGSLTAEIRCDNREQPFRCNHCSKRFSSKRIFDTHYANHRALRCDFCPKKFHDKTDLQQHLDSQACRRPYVCDICSKGFTRPDHLRKHGDTHKPKPSKPVKSVTLPNHSALEKPHRCHLCPKQFHRKLNLRQHLTSHNDRRPYVCNICSMGFKRRQHLRRHGITHKPNLSKPVKSITVPNLSALQKPYRCHLCPKQFHHKGNFRQHLGSHNGRRPYVCSICSKGFKRSDNLRKHVDTHKQKPSKPVKSVTVPNHSALQKSHRCHLCSKQFHHKGNLRQHLGSHNNRRPYVCTICSKGFKRCSNLRKHVDTHKQKPSKTVKSVTVPNHSAIQKSHRCHLCPKQFDRTTDLQRHLGSHTDRRPYVCDICSMGFKRPDHLRNHGKTHKPKPSKPVRSVTVPKHIPARTIPKLTKITDFPPKITNGDEVVISKLSSRRPPLLVPN